MRKIELEARKGEQTRVITSPWLRASEAAAYCGISNTMFWANCDKLPHGGNPRTKLYNVAVLDAWINNELEIPFAGQEPPKKPARSRRPQAKKDQGDDGMTNPRTGRRINGRGGAT